MAIPIAYNLRNLAVRKTTTLMTALGIALTVAVLLAVFALVEGLRNAFATTGNPLQVLVMRKGSNSELASNFARQQYQDLKFRPGIALDARQEPMVSLELVTVVNLPSVDNPDGVNITLRGLTERGIEMRDGLKIATGRWFRPGHREAVVGKAVAKRNPDAQVGKRLKFGRGMWEIVGVMDAGDSAVNSEMWADLNQAAADYDRPDVLSSALVRAKDEASVNALINELQADQKLNVMAKTEKEYYDSQTNSALPVQFLGTFVACIMAIGSSFAAMNTMYAAVAKRSKEIGTLRVLGFSRAGILFSFFLESLILSLLGGLIGCLLVLPLANVTTSIGSFTTFSDIAFNFRITPAILMAGLVFSLLMGAFGGLFPARAAAKKEILVALREDA
jgi:putative ABC transport system permease protein